LSRLSRKMVVVPQQQAANLFTNRIRGMEVKVSGQGQYTLPVSSKVIIPAQQEVLPSAALGWFSGGEIATSSSDQSGRRAAEPFFEVRADLDPGPEVVLVHGCSGKIRFTLEPQPLLQQWYRKLRQLIQKRYEI
jgi:putative peptide zinc metalloprotease protein